MTKKKSKIRRLGTNDMTSSGSYLRGFSYFLIGAICGIITYHSGAVTEFMRTYEEEYNRLMHGRRDYCTQNFESEALMHKINQEILHQGLALEQFQQILRNHIQFTGTAVIGTSGVGKTLFSKLLLENFPWKNNVQHYSWLTFADSITKDYELNKMLKRLSSCGHNIIVIRDLKPTDASYVNSFNQQAKEIVMTANYRLIMIYIFNISSYTEDAESAYQGSLHNFEYLRDVKTIRFRSFNQSDLRACIKQEAANLNVSLTKEDILRIEKSIQATHSGCKSVYSKVVLYSK